MRMKIVRNRPQDIKATKSEESRFTVEKAEV